MDRSEYPAMLASLSPNQAIDILSDRVRQVGQLNTDIADWLAERRRLEEQYSQGLRKLARRGNVASPQDLGVFATPWSSLVAGVESLAESHHVLAARIETDVEQPLRDFATKNRDMQAMSTIQGNLASMAKDIDNAQKKNEKLQGKGSRSTTGKMANASSDLENAQQQWDSQAPYVFETLQSVDETRLNHLRDVLTQYQTHEVDQVEKNRVNAESSLNVLLNVDTADEIRTFALRVLSGKSPRERQPSRPTPLSPSVSSPSVPQADDRSSQRSDSVGELTTPNKPRGLRRLGTVLSRRRESRIPAGAGKIADMPEVKAKTGGPSPFNSLPGRRGKLKEVGSSLEPPQEDAADRPRSPLRAMSSVDEVPTHSTFGQSQQPATNGMSALDREITPAPAPASSNGETLRDLSQLQQPLQPTEPPITRDNGKQPELPPVPAKDDEGFTTRPDVVDPITKAQQDAAAESSAPSYNVNIRDAPVTREPGEEDALASVATTLKMQAPTPAPSRRTGTVRGRRDVRSSIYDTTPTGSLGPTPQSSTDPTFVDMRAPIQEQEQEPISEVPQVASPGEIAPIAPPPAAAANESASRSGSGTTGLASGTAASVASRAFSSPSNALSGSPSYPFPSGGVASPSLQNLRMNSSTTGLGQELDNQSIRSGYSRTSTSSQATKHPELPAPGLNASIVETLSAWFEHGQATRGVMIGEVALAYNASDFASSLSNETIRLDNFAALDKVAPNPAFLTQTERPGEYEISLSQISRTQIGFKYQVQLPSSGPGSYAPLIVTPAWKIEANQAYAILTYGLNPAFDRSQHQGQSGPIKLSNVALVLHLEGARASTCMSKPVGTFNKERNCIYWQIGDIELSDPSSGTSSEQKLLARFATDGEARAGRIEARWELVGGSGSALSVSVRGGSAGGAGEDDPFVDEDANANVNASGSARQGWSTVAGPRKVVSGTYVST